VAASLGDDEAEPSGPERDDLHLAFAGPDRVLVHRWGSEEAVLLDAATGDEVVRAEGQPVWMRPAGDGSSGPVLVLAEVGAMSALRAIDADGDTVWERSEVGADECCQDTDDEDGAFLTWQAVTGEQLLLALDDGSVLADWGEPEEGVTRIPAGLEGWVAYDQEDRSVTAVDADSGAELWRTVDGEPNPVLPELWLMTVDDEVLGIPTDLSPD
jgi:outer membrane protein assembly factor BamB